MGDGSSFANAKIDTRAAYNGWAPGGYAHKCAHKCAACGSYFQGAKRCVICADCAYGTAIPEVTFHAKAQPLTFSGWVQSGDTLLMILVDEDGNRYECAAVSPPELVKGRSAAPHSPQGASGEVFRPK